MWTYKDKDILSHNDLPEGTMEIVYLITYDDGKKYLGKKTVRSNRRVPPTKAQLAIRKNYKRIELKDIPFDKYKGSSKLTVKMKVVSKEIIYCCSSKRTSSYIETRELMSRRAIEGDEYVNANITGKYFDNCLDGLIHE